MTNWETPFTFPNGMTLKNRLVFAPISTMSSNALGQLSQQELAFYQARSHQVGLIILGSATISLTGKAYENNVSISNDALIPNLRKYNATIKGSGAKSVIQLYHGGQSIEYLANQKRIPVVSNIPGEKYHELNEKEIQEIIEDFGKAIIRAIKADFDGVEIHVGNPFLIQAFLSPLTNRRNDFWGNRTKFLEVLLRLASEIRKNLERPFMIGVRLAMTEKAEGGLSLSDTMAIVSIISKLDIDYIHFNHDNIQANLGEMEMLQKAAGNIPVIGNGGIKNECLLEKMLNTVPLASVARPLILNPNFPFDGKMENVPAGLQKSIDSSPEWYFNEPQ